LSTLALSRVCGDTNRRHVSHRIGQRLRLFDNLLHLDRIRDDLINSVAGHRSHDLIKRGVIVITDGQVSCCGVRKERVTIVAIERQIVSDAVHKIRIRDKEATKCNGIVTFRIVHVVLGRHRSKASRTNDRTVLIQALELGEVLGRREIHRVGGAVAGVSELHTGLSHEKIGQFEFVESLIKSGVESIGIVILQHIDTVVVRVRADANGDLILTDGVNHQTEHLDGKADAVGDRAAVLVGAVVGAGVVELVEQVTVSAVELDIVESSFHGVLGGLNDLLLEAGDVIESHLVRSDMGLHGIVLRPIREGKANVTCTFTDGSTGSEGEMVIRERTVSNTTGVPQLTRHEGTLIVHSVGDLSPSLGLILGENARNVVGADGLLSYCGRLTNQKTTARCTITVICRMHVSDAKIRVSTHTLKEP